MLRKRTLVSLVAAALVATGGFAQDELGKRDRIKIAIEWQTITTKNYTIKYESVIPAATVTKVGKALENGLTQYIKVFHFKPTKKFDVKFLDSINTYEQEGGDPTHPGFYNIGLHCLVLRQLPFYQLLPTAYHEAFHQYLQTYVGRDVNIPIWYNEGLAVYFENMQEDRRTKKVDARNIDNRRIGMVKRAIFTRSAIPMAELIAATNELFHKKDRESLFYAQSFAVIYYMMQGPGKGRSVFTFARELKKSKNVAKAYEKCFGTKKQEKAVKSLEKRWTVYTAKLQIVEPKTI